MVRSMFLVSLALMIGLAGCKLSTEPRTLMSVSDEQAPRMRRAPYYGEFRLYAATASRDGDLEPAGEPLAQRRLNRREPIGFRRAHGELAAIAGSERVTLTPGQPYLWQMRPDAGQTDRAKTAVLLIGIGVAVTITLFAATSAPSIAWRL